MTVVSELMQAHIKKNASVAQSQEAYAQEAARLEERFNALEHYTAFESEIEKRKRKNKEISTFITTLKRQFGIVKFSLVPKLVLW